MPKFIEKNHESLYSCLLKKKKDALVILRTIAVFFLPLCQFVDLAYKNKTFKKILYNKLLYFIYTKFSYKLVVT